MVTQGKADTLWSLELRQTMLWFPVLMAIGIAVYFGLKREPGVEWCAVIAPPFLMIASGAARRVGLGGFLLCWATFGGTLGYVSAYAHVHLSSVRMLEWGLTETVEGRVIEVSRSASGAPRVLLDRVLIYGIDASETPLRVRVSLDPEDLAPEPGRRLRVFARIAAPEGPVEPGGYDFRRHAFFAGLGAVGYALGIAVPADKATEDAELLVWLARTRSRIARYLRDTLPGPNGAFAAAIIVGDRAHIVEADAEALRTANLAHLLAISGLHMGIVTGLLFTGLRLLLSSVSWLALRFPIKKIAAVFALAAAASYLALSGATVATQRAFIMVAVALIAVLLDRQAISLRAVAFAAVLVLLIRPVSLMEPGFQMSFAATTALVAGYSALRDWNRRRDVERVEHCWWLKIGRGVAVYFGALIFTSLLAGLATAPFAAYHFNRTAPFGLIANLAAVPVMGLVVAPTAIAAGLTLPIGVGEDFLRLMGEGIGMILAIAHWVAGFPGAIGYVPEKPAWTIAAFALGGLWLALMHGRVRMLGLLVLITITVVWVLPSPRPELLIAAEGRLAGVIGPIGRSIDSPTSRNFIASNWLRRDGDGASQEEANARPGIDGSTWPRIVPFANGWQVVIAPDRRYDDGLLSGLCKDRVLMLDYGGSDVSGSCVQFFGRTLSRMGALSVTPDGESLLVTPANTDAERPWTTAWRRDQ